jgi:hypothetical protein
MAERFWKWKVGQRRQSPQAMRRIRTLDAALVLSQILCSFSVDP